MRTVILMVSETPDLILGTIQSRAQRIHIRPIETDAIMNAMISRFGLSPDDAKHVAHLSSGSFIKAMEAISLGEENKFFLEQFKAMMRNSWARNVKGMKAMADVMAGDRTGATEELPLLLPAFDPGELHVPVPITRT